MFGSFYTFIQHFLQTKTLFGPTSPNMVQSESNISDPTCWAMLDQHAELIWEDL